MRVFFVAGQCVRMYWWSGLASVLTSDFLLNDEILHRIALASAAFGKLSQRVFHNHNLILHTNRSVYTAVCVSILTYGCEAMALYQHHVKKKTRGIPYKMPTTNPWTAMVGQDSSYQDKTQHQHRPNRRNQHKAGHKAQTPYYVSIHTFP